MTIYQFWGGTAAKDGKFLFEQGCADDDAAFAFAVQYRNDLGNLAPEIIDVVKNGELLGWVHD